MFNVQCPGCSAPYQVDERRVPALGLRMRCPKCATSFVVEKPSVAATSDVGNQSHSAPNRGPAQVRAPNPLKATMIGVAGPSPTGGDLPDKLRDNRLAGVDPPVARALDSQVTGLPKTQAGKTNLETPTTNEGDNRANADLDTSRPDLLPSLPRRKPPPPARAASAPESDLPAALAPRTKPEAPRIPAHETKIAKKCPGLDETWALPELAKEPPLVAPATLSSQDFNLDSPMPPTAPSRGVVPVSRSIDVDLPLARTSPQGNAVLPRVDDRDDLEIDLPSPFEALADYRRDIRDAESTRDFDLPSPASAVALPSPARVNLPTVPKAALPARSAGKTGLIATGKKSFGDVELLPDIDPLNESRLPIAVQRPQLSSSDLIPDLDGPIVADTRTATIAKEHLPQDLSLDASGPKLPDLTDALPNESMPPNATAQGSLRSTAAASIPPPQYGLEFGELHLNASADSREASITLSELAPDTSATVVRQSGGGTDFGEVSLDIGSGGVSTIGTADDGSLHKEKAAADLEFGGIPQEAAGSATNKTGLSRAPDTKAAAVARAHPIASQKAARRASSRSARLAAIGFFVLLVVGGASLSLIPDVGLFGYAFIADQLRKPEYERILSEQVASIQRALSGDTYPEAIRALQALERVQRSHPRAKNLRAYLGFIGYAVDLRFGPSPERNSKSKVLLDQLIRLRAYQGLNWP